MNKHISEDGKIRNCKAEPGNCPVKAPDGESYHSEDLNVLNKQREEIQEKIFGATTTLKKPVKYTQKELNEIAHAANSKADFDLVIEKGGVRALNTLAKHPFLDRESIIRIEEKTDNKNVLKNLKESINYPIEKLNERELRRRPLDVIAKQMKENPPDDELVNRVINTKGYVAAVPALEYDANISDEMFTEIAAKNLKNIHNRWREHPRYDFKKVLQRTNSHQLNYIVRQLKDPNEIRDVYNHLIEKDGENSNHLVSVALNKNTPLDVAKKISENDSLMKYDNVALGLYKNKNIDEEILNKVKKNKTVQSMIKIDKIESDGNYNKLFAEKSGTGSIRRPATRFNPEEVKKQGLNGDDIDVLVRYKMNNWLWQTTYDPETGVYSGYID